MSSQLFSEWSEWKKAVVLAGMEALERAGPWGAVLLKTAARKSCNVSKNRCKTFLWAHLSQTHISQIRRVAVLALGFQPATLHNLGFLDLRFSPHSSFSTYSAEELEILSNSLTFETPSTIKAFFTTIAPLPLRCLGLNGTSRARPLLLLSVGKSFASGSILPQML